MGEYLIGYVLKAGEKYDKVDDSVTIYATTSCHTILRRGATKEGIEKKTHNFWFQEKSIKSTDENLLALNYDAIVQSVYNETTEDASSVTGGSALSKAISKTVPLDKVLKLDTDSLIESKAKSEVSDAFSAAVSGDTVGFTKHTAAYKMLARRKAEDEILLPDAIVNMATETDIPIPDDVVLNEENKTKLQKFKEGASKAKQKVIDGMTDVSDFVEDGANTLTKWLDDIEATIDALPTMSEMGSDVYEVQESINSFTGIKEWVYTGNKTPMDQSVNQHIQQAKNSICAFLNKMLTKVTKKGEDMLQEHVNKMQAAQPIMKIMNLIKKVPSLGTIIDWAKSIVDFFTTGYKMVFGVYKMIRAVLEMIIMRIPRLINKILKKVTEFNCPLASKMDIKINSEEV